MDKKRKLHLKYIGILVLLCLPLIGLMGLFISRNIITPNDEFFVVSKGEAPFVPLNTWKLTIDGHVNNSLTFNYSNFTAQPSKEIVATLQCVDGFFGTAKWKGVPIKDLLDLVEVKAGAVDVVFYAADDYSSSLTIEEARMDNVLLAYEMNNEALPVEHGFPVRVVAPNQLGYKWVKWVERMEIVDYDYIGFWESRGWSDNAYRTAFTDWFVHAGLLAFSFLLGGIALMSGLKRSPITDFYHNLPKFVNKNFHIIVGIGFFTMSLSTFFYWVISTILNRGAIFYTIHGITALISMIIVIPGAITGFKKSRKRDSKNKTWHYKFNLFSFYLFLATIIIGFSLTFIRWFYLY
ncbi:MAG: molybdopterin-dependent oxidoreductase [Candidatus Thorarchaeota archaeon]